MFLALVRQRGMFPVYHIFEFYITLDTGNTRHLIGIVAVSSNAIQFLLPGQTVTVLSHVYIPTRMTLTFAG